MIAAALAVEDGRISSMFAFFFIALLIVSPFGYKRMKVLMAERRELLGRTVPETNPDGTEPVAEATSDPDDLAAVIDAVGVAARELAEDPAGHRVVELPIAPTVEGRPADAAVVNALLDDAVRRSGLVGERTTAPDGGQRLRLVRG